MGKGLSIEHVALVEEDEDDGCKCQFTYADIDVAAVANIRDDA